MVLRRSKPQIGADVYAPDAGTAAAIAQDLIG